MKRIITISTLAFIIFPILFILFLINKKEPNLLSPEGNSTAQTELPLNKYTHKNLKKRSYTGSKIIFEDILYEEEKFTSRLFFFESDGKKTSGLINIPSSGDNLPVILMIRGFVPRESYETGTGTKNSSRAFARNGFITLAPDFLGYGSSASPSADVFEERLEKNTTILNLLKSIENLKNANADKVGIWGHSNGGQLALSTLQITGKPYPTVLWAPVSKPFPYSILYYTDEYDDHGKALRKVLAQFEKNYNVDNYNITNYYDWINPKTPIQLHQGGLDDAVPKDWSDELYNALKKIDLDIVYYSYPDADHNFSGPSWQTIINRDILFFKQRLSQ